MANWGKKYQCEFDPFAELSATPVFRLEFLFKDYDGVVSSIKGGAVPVVHSWATDEPKPPIKGSSLSITLINEGSTPLTSFLSTEDDGVKVKLFRNDELIFEGFLVQDDCSEIMVDFNHEINLTANDNLGLLKNVSLDQATLLNTLFPNILIGSFPITNTLVINGFTFTPVVGVPFEIVNHSDLNGTYTPLTVTATGGGYLVTVADTLALHAASTGDIRTSGLDLDNKQSLFTIYQYCIGSTGVQIGTNFWNNIYDEEQVALTPFMVQTLIDPYTFLKNDTEYLDCYTVLEYIMGRWNMTLFQSKGVWNIVRWDELRYYDNAIHGFRYDTDFNLIDRVDLDEVVTAGIGEELIYEASPNHRVFRAYHHNKETFNYKQPYQLLRNYNLQQLGNLRTTYTTGSGVNLQTVNEYNVKWWYDYPFNPANADYNIRVIYDYLGNEITRYLVVENDNIISYRIEATQGDSFTYTFTFRTLGSHAGSLNHSFHVYLTDGSGTVFLRDDGTWTAGPGWTYNIPAGDNSNVDHTVEITGIIPHDGLLYFALDDVGLGGDETRYQDIRLDYVFRINESTKVIGHTHKSTQTANIKQIEDEEIYMDNSPRNSIAGTLFRGYINADTLLQQRTTKWHRATFTESLNLGEITTRETLFWRRTFRTILEGTIISNNEETTAGLPAVSMLSIFKYTLYPTLNFVWGKLDIDYKNNSMTGTLWEIWKDDEAEADLTSGYEFNYLYDTK